MRRLLLSAVAAALAVTGLALSLAGVSGATSSRSLPAAKPAPAHLLIYAQEYSLWPSRTKLPAGTVDVQLWNRGQDAHDVRIRRLNPQGTMVGAVVGAVSVTPSGAIHTAVWHLKAGRYEIYCSLPGHMAMGMRAKLRVVG
jgi:plastocyanin